MKNFLSLFVLTLVFLWMTPVLAAATGEQIDNYQVDINILKDSTLVVTETIDYNFGDYQKHGIFRDIPLTVKRLSEAPFELYDIKVTDEKGQAYKNEISQWNHNVNIKIGSEDIYVSGQKTYIISYKVRGAFYFSEDGSSLNWNAIGTDWTVPIIKSQIKISLPSGILENQVNIDCVFGSRGSVNKCKKISGSNIKEMVFNVYALSVRNGVTIKLNFDKGLISQPTPPNIFIAFLKKYGITLLPIITFLVMFFLWYYKGRDPKGRGVVIAQYMPPEDMMPAELGTIYDERVHNKDISSEIIYLAIRGYLRIRRVKKGSIFPREDYILEELKDTNDLPREYQKELMANLFSGKFISAEDNVELSADCKGAIYLSSLKKDAYRWIKIVEKNIYNLVTQQGYFVANPQKIRNIYLIIFIIAFVSFQILGDKTLAIFVDPLSAGISFISIIVSIFIIVAFGNRMPKKTAKGVLAKEYILGLKEYINVAEKDRIKFHNAPEKNPQIFEKLLPYAMVFGLEKEWAKQFEGIYLQEPNWYVSGQAANFSVVSFGASLSGFRSAASSVTSPSSSGGAGGVGGGGGGGGGGSW